MKTKLAIAVALIAVLGVAGTAPATAEKPLRAEMALNFQFDPVVPWEGTLTFGEADNPVVYGIEFIHIDTGKPWGADPKPNHKVLFYGEEFNVYTLDDLGDFDEMVMQATDVGSSSFPNAKAHANGVVTEVFSSVDYVDGVFDESLIGRNLHWSGVITFVEIPDVGPVPTNFDGPFRIN